MKIQFYFTLIILCITLYSCQQLTGNIWERDAIDNYNSPYQGIYTGTYGGDYSGKFNFQVGKSGTIFGLRDDVDNFGGKVYEGGALLNVQSPTTGFILIGSLVSIKGTWKQNDNTGNWTATKQ